MHDLLFFFAWTQDLNGPVYVLASSSGPGSFPLCQDYNVTFMAKGKSSNCGMVWDILSLNCGCYKIIVDSGGLKFKSRD